MQSRGDVFDTLRVCLCVCQLTCDSCSYMCHPTFTCVKQLTCAVPPSKLYSKAATTPTTTATTYYLVLQQLLQYYNTSISLSLSIYLSLSISLCLSIHSYCKSHSRAHYILASTLSYDSSFGSSIYIGLSTLGADRAMKRGCEELPEERERATPMPRVEWKQCAKNTCRMWYNTSQCPRCAKVESQSIAIHKMLPPSNKSIPAKHDSYFRTFSRTDCRYFVSTFTCDI